MTAPWASRPRMKPASCKPAVLARKASTTSRQPGATGHASGAQRSRRAGVPSPRSSAHWLAGMENAP